MWACYSICVTWTRDSCMISWLKTSRTTYNINSLISNLMKYPWARAEWVWLRWSTPLWTTQWPCGTCSVRLPSWTKTSSTPSKEQYMYRSLCGLLVFSHHHESSWWYMYIGTAAVVTEIAVRVLLSANYAYGQIDCSRSIFRHFLNSSMSTMPFNNIKWNSIRAIITTGAYPNAVEREH